jgi:transcriptional regulator with XRE-family HTH domain
MPRIGNPERRRRHFIREWRLFRDLSQEQLADMVFTTTGVATSKTSISHIENMVTGYTQDSLEAIAEALGTLPAVLLSRPPTEDDRYGTTTPIPQERRHLIDRPRIKPRQLAKRVAAQQRKK